MFSAQFGLPACTEANGCFRKVNQTGDASPLPASSGELERGWAQEIATDVEVAHGICPSCQILLVEAESNANADLYAAEQTAASLGATEISNSWGGGEPISDSPAFNHPGHRHHGVLGRLRLPQLVLRKRPRGPPTTQPAHRTSSPSAARG